MTFKTRMYDENGGESRGSSSAIYKILLIVFVLGVLSFIGFGLYIIIKQRQPQKTLPLETSPPVTTIPPETTTTIPLETTTKPLIGKLPQGKAKPIDVTMIYNEMNKSSSSVVNNHTNDKSRLTLSENILTMVGLPDDIDKITEKSDRQRNEIRFKDPSLIVEKGSKGAWVVDVRVDSYAPVDGFYHIVQVKRDPAKTINDQPPCCVSLRKGDICIYDGSNSEYTTIMPIPTNKWFTVWFEADVVAGKVKYTFPENGKTGSVSTDISETTSMYLKAGVYHKNGITTKQSMSFKNFIFVSQ